MQFFWRTFLFIAFAFCLTENKYDSYKDGHLIGLSFNANDDNEFVYGDDESPPRGTAGAPRYHDVDSADGWFHLQTWPLMMMSPLQTGAAGISQMELPDIIDYISRLDREAKVTRVRLALD